MLAGNIAAAAVVKKGRTAAKVNFWVNFVND
jgi:hypothetical protein